MAAGRLEDQAYPACTTGRTAELLGVQQAFQRPGRRGAVRPQQSAGNRRYTRRRLAKALRIQELVRPGGHDLASALRIASLEDDLPAERKLTASLHHQLALQDDS